MKDRKQRVLLAAQKLFIEKGFAATSVQDILNESNISKGTFYNYFSSKNECLISILAHAHDIASARRQELLIGKDPSDIDVFVKQIAVRMEVNREQHLIPLYEAIFHSEDPELSEFVKKLHIYELAWLSKRLVDIYGEIAAPYAMDGAIMTAGMMKHYIHICMNHLNKDINRHQLIYFVLRRIEAIMAHMMETNDQLIGQQFPLPADYNWSNHTLTKETLIERLSSFANSVTNDSKAVEYIEFLAEELKSEQPRLALLETILLAFGDVFTGSSKEAEAKELAFTIYTYLKELKSSLNK
ncbi:TetR/AcrR family transcriptional regulator [Siminovitchia sediminis]|uniref:TetR/AcrR family transcriptional regulator n=1 Tax=Siminovitchia sediminis TaxID=1274353 RepID=A0ABW4KM81_9BACI